MSKNGSIYRPDVTKEVRGSDGKHKVHSRRYINFFLSATKVPIQAQKDVSSHTCQSSTSECHFVELFSWFDSPQRRLAQDGSCICAHLKRTVTLGLEFIIHPVETSW